MLSHSAYLSIRLYIAVLLIALTWLLIGCTRDQDTPPATQVPQAAATATPLPRLTGVDLLQTVDPVCESPQPETIACVPTDAGHRVQVDVPASTFARLRLGLPPARQPLTGNETLVLRARRTGTLVPNLYLVDQDGRRISVRLDFFGLDETLHDVHVPLREVRDDEGAAPDYTRLQSVELVFEWADMQGELELKSLRFEPVWEETLPPPSTPAGVTVPPKFTVQAVAGELHNPTQMEITSEGDLLVSEQFGRIWWYRDMDQDGVYETRRLYATGFVEVVGLLYDPVDGGVWIGGRGQLWRTLDTDGDRVADVRELRLDGLPWGRHQNNGLAWNPVPDPFSGEPPHHWLYFGLGSTGDLGAGGPLNATILRFPRDGQGQDDLEVVARGVRNAYDVIWAPVPVDGEPVWSLFAGENGPDFNDAPDEINHIRWGRHYGFPDQFGPVPDDQDGRPYAGPVYPVAPHASADGLAYITRTDWPQAYRTLYVALYGEVFSPTRVGHTVDRITLWPVETADGLTFRGESSVFVDGLDRPLALTTDRDGHLLIADYATGLVYRVQPAQ